MKPGNQNPTLGQPSTPEEDIALQAIESLDVEGSAEPSEPSPAVSVAHEPSPSPEHTPSATNSSLAAANAEPALASESFQPFVQQKPVHNPLKVVLIILLSLVVLAGGTYFGWQFFL